MIVPLPSLLLLTFGIVLLTIAVCIYHVQSHITMASRIGTVGQSNYAEKDMVYPSAAAPQLEPIVVVVGDTLAYVVTVPAQRKTLGERA